MNQSHLEPLLCQLLKSVLGDIAISKKALSYLCSLFSNSLLSLGIQCRNAALVSGRNSVNLADVSLVLLSDDNILKELFDFKNRTLVKPLLFSIPAPVQPPFKPISIRTYKNLPCYWENHLANFPSEHTFRATEMSFTPDPLYLRVIKKRTSQIRQVEDNLKRLVPLKSLPSKIRKMVKSEALVPRRDLSLINYSHQISKGIKRDLEDEGMDDEGMDD